MELTEKEIQDQILDWLLLNDYFVWRNNTGRKGHIQFGKKGSCDIIGMDHAGKFLGLEVKKPKEPMRPEQIKFMEEVHKHGGRYYTVHSLGETIEYLK